MTIISRVNIDSPLKGGKLTIEVNLSTQGKIRVWIGTRFLVLAGRILGCGPDDILIDCHRQ